MVVGKDTLYIYGGMMEIKDKEITLDDLYSLNLSKLDEWKCIIPVCSTSISIFCLRYKLITMILSLRFWVCL